MPAAAAVYLPEPYPTRRQGDIVLAPSTVLWAPDRLPVPEVPQAAPAHLGASAFAPASYAVPGGPGSGVVETLWSPVMIVSHDCDLEKDFNERVRALMEDGMGEDDAVREASDDPTLDPLAVVAPLLPYSRVPEHRHAGIRSGQRIGYLPLPPLPDAGKTDYLVDLGRLATVDHLLFTTRLASLTLEAAGVLRYKLAEMYASRDLSVATSASSRG